MNIFQNKNFQKKELDLPYYATKSDLKNATGVIISKCAKKVGFANLKSNVDKLDINKLKNVPSNLSSLKSKVDKLVPVPADLSELSDVVKLMLLKKMYIMLRQEILYIKYLILLT